MPVTLNGTLSTVSSEAASQHHVEGLPLPVALKPMRQARRLRLRVDHGERVLRLTTPWRYPAKRALAWAGEQGAWVERQLARAPAPRPFADGTAIPFRGRELTLVWAQGERRGVRLEGDRLLIGGPQASFGRAVERWLKSEALAELSACTRDIAAAHGVSVRGVAIGDPVSRWGSCSADGAIRYSWRLILAPPEALRFVVAHEVAHRLHMDHSPAFKAAEARLFGGPTALARGALRAVGPQLRGVGRGV
jgi:predicted metal-dependent hydrolase